MTYMIERRETGGARVMLLQPVEIATFKSELHAEAFVNMMVGAEGAPEAPSPHSTEAAAPPQATARASDPGEPDDAVWDEALARVGNGEGVKVVAEDLGLKFTKLRGRWAAHVQKLKRQVTSEETDDNAAADASTDAKTRDEILPATIDCGRQMQADRPRKPASAAAFSAEEDVEIATTGEADLGHLAERLGRTVDGRLWRKRVLEDQVAKEMAQ